MRLLKAIGKPSRLSEIWRCRQFTPDWLALTTAYIHLCSRYPLLIRTPTGPVELQTKSDVSTFWLIHIAHSYRLPTDAGMVVDAGANIGAFTLYALQNAPQSRVIAIEPAPDTFQRMSHMLDNHKLSGRCRLLQKALGDAPGQTFMNLDVESQFRRTGETTGTLVPVTTLEQIVSEFGPIDFLKIDAEGAEYPSLLHAPADVLSQVGCIAMEYHPVKTCSPHRLLDHLISHGFTPVSQRDDGGGYGLAHLIRKDWNPALQRTVLPGAGLS
jgi:FkbM family methyltransferase